VSRVDGQERRTHIVPGGADDGKQVFQTPSGPPTSFCETRGMPKTQYFTATSIDGFIADLDNSLDWLYEAHTADHGEGRWDDFIGAVGAMAMGATTYEWVLEHERLLEEPRKWHDFYGDIPCWVFTHRDLAPIADAALTFAQGNVMPVHDTMTAAAGGKNIWLVGGGDLVGQFADQGLLDEILIHTAPVTLGGGAPLLPRHTNPVGPSDVGERRTRGRIRPPHLPRHLQRDEVAPSPHAAVLFSEISDVDIGSASSSGGRNRTSIPGSKGPCLAVRPPRTAPDYP
jgi:dihydrofolate reductase